MPKRVPPARVPGRARLTRRDGSGKATSLKAYVLLCSAHAVPLFTPHLYTKSHLLRSACHRHFVSVLLTPDDETTTTTYPVAQQHESQRHHFHDAGLLLFRRAACHATSERTLRPLLFAILRDPENAPPLLVPVKSSPLRPFQAQETPSRPLADHRPTPFGFTPPLLAPSSLCPHYRPSLLFLSSDPRPTDRQTDTLRAPSLSSIPDILHRNPPVRSLAQTLRQTRIHQSHRQYQALDDTA
ncbi:hypothetical protein VDGE_30027 [Verticillium dahliae]|uniref:Uncharacterized protein n=1 Tax=Verticillium dahliae TaxID=27337 RepID=A0A444S5R3_VERDA|nr:hypothetical protein VDGE_30027 [Verticillium dahliae]